MWDWIIAFFVAVIFSAITVWLVYLLLPLVIVYG